MTDAGLTGCRASVPPQVVLTRERGKNGKVAEMLDKKKIRWLELPLIETIEGPDRYSNCPDVLAAC